MLNDMPLVDSTHSMRVLETSHPPTFYIPTSDVDMSRLQSVAGNSFFVVERRRVLLRHRRGSCDAA